MQRVVRAFPILPGKEAELRKFAAEMRRRAPEAILKKWGVSHESWYLQQIPSGLMVIVVTEITERPVTAAAQDYAAASEPVDIWFKQQIRDLSGIDPSKEPLGPPTSCIYDWSAEPVNT